MAEKYFAQPSGTNAQQHFSNIPSAEIERSKFDRSFGHKTTFNAGSLVPVFLDEVLPGDTFHVSTTGFARLSTPLKPIMDNMYLDVHFFFVPYRLVWDNWEKFCGERVNPADDPTTLRVPKTGVLLKRPRGDFYDYAGIPILNSATATDYVEPSALPARAYRLIWNEWYRDENLQNSQVIQHGDGPDGGGVQLLSRNKRKDYFTSCLPWPQKGNPVYIPIATSAAVVTNNQPPTFTAGANVNNTLQMTNPSAKTVAYSGAANSTGANMVFGNQSGLMVDLTNATAITINDLRTAFQIQRLLERDARGGTRYPELILSHFGVQSDDGRLQRPEYLGGGTSMVNINPIAQTFPDANSGTGDLAAYGQVVTKGGFVKSFTEHGIVIGLASVRADLTYQSGIDRWWMRRTRYDFYWPALAHLGEQAVLNREVLAKGLVSGGASEVDNDSGVFGYQERYAEYRYKPSYVSGAFRSEDATSLDVWHLAQDFGSTRPALNLFFLLELPPIDRIVAVPTEPHFLADFWFSFQCDRPMPVYSVPGLIDHF